MEFFKLAFIGLLKISLCFFPCALLFPNTPFSHNQLEEFYGDFLCEEKEVMSAVGLSSSCSCGRCETTPCPIELTGRLVFPDNPDYDAARQEYNTFFNRFPLVIVFAQENQDIINGIKWARFHEIPFRLRSGRHNYEGLSIVDNGLIIDVSEMKRIEIDKKHHIVTVETGITDIELATALSKHHLVVPNGLCFTTGIAGFTLGGGQSAFCRQFGLAIDQLLEVEMIDANGCIIHASACKNADLFWALRGGGGGNFGVCTKFKFRTHKVNKVVYANIGWALEDLSDVIQAWQLYNTTHADNRLTPLLSLVNSIEQRHTFPGYEQKKQEFLLKFPGETEPISSAITFQCVFLGSVKELHKLLQPLLNTGNPQQVFIKEIPWIEAEYRIGLTQPVLPEPFKSTGPFAPKALPKNAISIIKEFMESPPENNIVAIVFHGLNGAVSKIKPKDTAYYYRNAWFNINPWATWTSPNSSDAGINWINQLSQKLRDYTSGEYVNSPDLSLINWQEAYYGMNYKRLRHVKRKYDPENVFHFPQSIQP